MTWVTWRQGCTETLIAAGILALVAALLIPTGLHMASVYDHDGLAACVNSNSRGCQEAVGAFTQQFQNGVGAVFPWFNLIPGIVGVLLRIPPRNRARTALCSRPRSSSSSRAGPTSLRGRRASPAAAGSQRSSASRLPLHFSLRS